MFKNLIAIFGLIIIIIIAVLFYLKFEVKEQKLDNILDQCTLSLEKKLKTEQMNALEIALVLSKNDGLVNALENDDEDLGYKILSDIMDSLKQNVHRTIRTQMITSDLHVFARSWDDVYAGMPLEDYRTDLNYIKSHKAPRTSIEVGRRLGIKATVPIYKDNVLLGFIEVIDFFEKITDYFREQGIDLYVLLDDKYYSTAVFMQENLTIKNYIVANINYNTGHIKVLEKIDFKELQANRILSSKNRHIFFESMHNGEGEAIGAFVFVLPDKYLDYFRSPEDDISFLINVTRSDLYAVEKQQFHNVYSKNSASELLYLKDSIANEDRMEFLQEAYKKLDTYSKDELIQLMLENKSVKKIDGKIK
ncbi:Sensory domain of two-component sensor kinase [Epsilonproteobacteria bacterium SCGC AD-308-E02]|jgi:hypothetical protein|nr:Sensory domain of two-component sensor kinase [Epsilonproteobacteria bacterium SCGC AD-308-E02]SMP87870.1 Sensory domain of two-component sensor kinase [Epsilonproteobacteria bacterium SCGC AD-308-O04]